MYKLIKAFRPCLFSEIFFRRILQKLLAVFIKWPYIRHLFYGGQLGIALLYLNLSHSPKFSVGFSFITFFSLCIGDPGNGNFLSWSGHWISFIVSSAVRFSSGKRMYAKHHVLENIAQGASRFSIAWTYLNHSSYTDLHVSRALYHKIITQITKKFCGRKGWFRPIKTVVFIIFTPINCIRSLSPA